MRRIACVSFVMILAALGGCAAVQSDRSVLAAARSANYTEDYIYDYWIQTALGKNTGVGGSNVSEFSRGGTSGQRCCARMPGVGQTIRVVWEVGGRQDDRSKWKTYTRDVDVKGGMPKPNYKLQSYLIVRFFPDHEVETELLAGDGDLGPENLRIDRLFFGRPRVMRKKEE
ncbi:DUF3304 domain-containing protein [Cupriavidus sp. 2KB_3]|uniref:DUF3304 domain-containing protein n=1 Tax=Cupriavidus TaxID=106589 RepID=UPI0011F06B05|nr:DUF3304 domain-containing protein [Cupriavidus campinensis]